MAAAGLTRTIPRRKEMAYITITINAEAGSTTLQERVLPSDLESEFFCTHLVDRLRWAVEDAFRPRTSAQLQQPQRLSAGASTAESVLPL
jgi:hypothetical protein